MAGITYAHEFTDLDCFGQSITSLTGIESFTGLTFVSLGYNQIIDATPLNALIQLHTLFIWEKMLKNDWQSLHVGEASYC